MKLKGVGQATLFLVLFGMTVAASATVSSWIVLRNLSAALKAKIPAPAAPSQQPQEAAAPTVEVDFYSAAGITPDALRQHLADTAKREHEDSIVLLLTFRNSEGDCLTESSVPVLWNSGRREHRVGRSGVLQVAITPDMLSGLRMIVPEGYDLLQQSSLPFGSAFDPILKLDSSDAPYNVHYDGEIQTTIRRGLKRFQMSEQLLSFGDFQSQLRTGSCSLTLESPAQEKLTPQETYEKRRDCIVVVAQLFPDNSVDHATGFVIASNGVVVTNYHVVDKPTAISRAVMTSDRRMHRVTGILAADKAADLAIIKIDADGLHAAPLSGGDPEGSPVTLISHPQTGFYSLATGHISRYWATVMYGRETHLMGVTADFSEGSSGAPVFNSRGNVTGVVTSTRDLGYQMVLRMATPVAAIRRMVKATPKDIVLAD